MRSSFQGAQLLCTSPVLKSPDFQRWCTLQTDESDCAVGVVLSQRDERRRPPCWLLHSKITSPKTRVILSTVKKKRISCNKAVSPYLLCVLARREFLIQDDHQSLKWLDILLYKPISGPEDMTSFQDDINLFSNWVVDNHLALNPLKTKFMYISRSCSFNFPPLLLNGSKLE